MRWPEPTVDAEPNSAQQQAEISAMTALALATVGLLGLLGTALMVLGDATPSGYHPLAIGLLSLVVVATAGLGRRRPALFSPARLVLILPLGVAALTVGAFLAGPAFAPLISMGFLWCASSITYLPRRTVIALMAWVGLLYAALLVFQSGHFEPVVRWLITVGLMVTTALQWTLLVDRSRRLAQGEQAARAEAEQARAQLELASEQKTRFLARMSHELRTPLNAIIGFSEVLARRSFGELNPKQAEYVRDVVDSGQHLLALVDDLLDLAKVETGTLELDASRIDLGELLSSSVALFKEQAGRQSVILDLDLDPHLPTVEADARKLKQVVFNLLANAVRFTPAGGQVTMAARGHGNRVRFSVTDTGPGIAAEDRETIFEEYHQGAPAGEDRSGTGLGLPLARRLVDLHGGRLWLESEPSLGSTFTVELPVRLRPRDTAAPWTPDEKPGPERLVLGEPDSPRGRIENARLFYVTGSPLVAVALLTAAIFRLHPVPELAGYHEGRYLLLTPLGVAIIVAGILRPQWLGAPAVIPYLIAFITTVGSLGLLIAGPPLGYFLALFYVTGAGSLVLATPRHRVALLVFMSTCYGLVMTLGDDNPAPLASWVMVTGFVVVTVVIFGRFVARIEAQALAERAARKEAERVRIELELAGRHKTEFLANMSHELRTPLNVIIGFSEVLESQAFGPLNAKQAEYVDDVLASGRHLLGLISDILDLAKAEAGRMELQTGEVDLEVTLPAVLERFREEAARRDVHMQLDSGPGLGRIEADEAKLVQALGHLVSNALKFTPDGGGVSVRTALESDHVEISVTDTGRGIAPADQERIFEAFAHGDDSATTEQGSGLGLALARRYAELHGGSVSVLSAVGTGATFILRLPMLRASVEPAAPAEVA
jgi:signal transduction histidine kinase